MKCQAIVIGAGPAGLMAAEVMARAGLSVSVFDAMPSVGRKFLMAGKSGLNLTMDVGPDELVAPFAAPELEELLRAFDAQAVKDWAEGLGQSLFTGSTGRVFPTVMKASPLLRAWLARLDALGVRRLARWQWTGGMGPFQFATPDGPREVESNATILAVGGASWSRLGSTGAWSTIFRKNGYEPRPFQPANAALQVAWSSYMQPHLGSPLKGIAWQANSHVSRGEAVLSAKGLEGSGVYAVSKYVRAGSDLTLDLLPDLSVERVAERLAETKIKTSMANRLRKAFGLSPQKIALLQEWARPIPKDPATCSALLKGVRVRHSGLRPLDEAISTAGGVPFDVLDASLMLRRHAGVFCAGEMLDWEAPTGGYLITGCLATGAWAGKSAVDYVARTAVS